MIKPILQTPRYRLVADELARAIRAGELPAGSKMPADKDLVHQLGVSRTTVREAMIALEAMGYVVTRFGAGAYVADELPDRGAEEVGLPGFFELVEARYRIEPEIAAVAAASVTREGLLHLSACIDRISDGAADFAEVERHDREFHISIARFTGNSVFVSIVSDFWRARQRFPEWTRTSNRQNEADIRRFYRREHSAILDALSARDPEAARRAMRTHCRNSGRPLLERWHRLEEGPGAPVSGREVLDRISAWTPQP